MDVIEFACRLREALAEEIANEEHIVNYDEHDDDKSSVFEFVTTRHPLYTGTITRADSASTTIITEDEASFANIITSFRKMHAQVMIKMAMLDMQEDHGLHNGILDIGINCTIPINNEHGEQCQVNTFHVVVDPQVVNYWLRRYNDILEKWDRILLKNQSNRHALTFFYQPELQALYPYHATNLYNPLIISINALHVLNPVAKTVDDQKKFPFLKKISLMFANAFYHNTTAAAVHTDNIGSDNANINTITPVHATKFKKLFNRVFATTRKLNLGKAKSMAGPRSSTATTTTAITATTRTSTQIPTIIAGMENELKTTLMKKITSIFKKPLNGDIKLNNNHAFGKVHVMKTTGAVQVKMTKHKWKFFQSHSLFSSSIVGDMKQDIALPMNLTALQA
ncbi:hypothetical protein V1514DRAFT_324186 [Lipomyces japonicus]|uniref:uncharacterized protein n=1 Tax=Lipomyces japonicus TaxID=56871 RepID=UPI0034CEC2C1